MDKTDKTFNKWLIENNLDTCTCGRKIDRKDVSWNNASTEAGTGYSVINIICESCDSEIAHWSSWYPWLDDFEDLVENVLDDYKP